MHKLRLGANLECLLQISKSRRVTISDFKGKTFVNIREYYEKDGKTLPGKKVGGALLPWHCPNCLGFSLLLVHIHLFHMLNC